MKINKQTEKLVEDLVKSKRTNTKSLINPSYTQRIKDTGMDMRKLGLMLDIAYDTMLAYSCGKRKIPPEVANRLNDIIKTLKGKPAKKSAQLSNEEENQLMQRISDEFDKKRRDPTLQKLMDATGLSEKECLNLRWSDIKDGTISCPTCGHKLKKPRKNQSESAKKASVENGRLGGRPKKK